MHRVCLYRILIYGVFLFYTLLWVFASHDGRTVDLMLARLGEGPLGRTLKESDDGKVDCEAEDCVDIRRTINRSMESEDSVKDLCWGYEKGCKKENRLFVPQCEGPSRPWYVFFWECASQREAGSYLIDIPYFETP